MIDLSKLTPEQRDALAAYALSQLLNGGPGDGAQVTPPVMGAQELPQQAGERAPGVPPPVENRQFGEAPPPNPPTVQRLPSAAQWVEKQMGNLQAVGETNYRAGITRPKKDPIQAGIAAQGKYEAKMRDPEVLRRRAEQLRKTNMDEWAAMAERLGAARLVSGVVDRRFKVERFVSAFQPKLEAHLRTIDGLPDVTDADRERRMLENLRGLKKLKGVA